MDRAASISESSVRGPTPAPARRYRLQRNKSPREGPPLPCIFGSDVRLLGREPVTGMRALIPRNRKARAEAEDGLQEALLGTSSGFRPCKYPLKSFPPPDTKGCSFSLLDERVVIFSFFLRQGSAITVCSRRRGRSPERVEPCSPRGLLLPPPWPKL